MKIVCATLWQSIAHKRYKLFGKELGGFFGSGKSNSSIEMPQKEEFGKLSADLVTDVEQKYQELLEMYVDQPDKLQYIKEAYEVAVEKGKTDKLFSMHEMAKYSGRLGVSDQEVYEQADKMKKLRRELQWKSSLPDEARKELNFIIGEYRALKDQPEALVTFIRDQQLFDLIRLINQDQKLQEYVKSLLVKSGDSLNSFLETLTQAHEGLNPEDGRKLKDLLDGYEYKEGDKKEQVLEVLNQEENRALVEKMFHYELHVAWQIMKKVFDDPTVNSDLASFYFTLLEQQFAAPDSLPQTREKLKKFEHLERVISKNLHPKTHQSPESYAENQRNALSRFDGFVEHDLREMIGVLIKYASEVPKRDMLVRQVLEDSKHNEQDILKKELLPLTFGFKLEDEQLFNEIVNSYPEKIFHYRAKEMVDQVPNGNMDISVEELFTRVRLVLDKSFFENIKSENFDFEKCLPAWLQSHYAVGEEKKDERIQFIAKNINNMIDLEGETPGITSALMKEYGIYDFARYDVRMLQKQYEEKDNTDLPYGLVLFPRDDYNGGLQATKAALMELHSALAERGILLRVVECDNKIDIAKRLLKLKTRYGATHKISFAVIGGHGSEDSIQFGSIHNAREIQEKTSPRFLFAEDLKGRGVQRSSEFFEEGATIILASCSTGALQGIGSRISESFGAHVIAPNVPSNIKSINVITKPGGGIDFDVEYWQKEHRMQYLAGQHIEE